MSKQLNEIQDLLERALINARESTSPSLSAIILELKNEMKSIKTDLCRMEKKMEPVVAAFDNVKGWKAVIMIIAQMAVALGAIVASVYAVKKWIIGG
ncbi:MAG: hypothetical protein AAB875_04450 [Patescibacteria group bacterium]